MKKKKCKKSLKQANTINTMNGFLKKIHLTDINECFEQLLAR